MAHKPRSLVGCYLRVSTVSQNEAGQRSEISRWLKGQGIELKRVRWFIDKDSGECMDRTEFMRLQRDVFAGEIGTVVVWRLDRLSRSLRDGINVLSDWCDKGLRVVSVTQQIDFRGALGKMLAAVLLGVAEMEQETRRERQRAGIEAAKTRGVYKGRMKGTTKAKPSRVRELAKQGNTAHEIQRALDISRNTYFRYLKQTRTP